MSTWSWLKARYIVMCFRMCASPDDLCKWRRTLWLVSNVTLVCDVTQGYYITMDLSHRNMYYPSEDVLQILIRQLIHGFARYKCLVRQLGLTMCHCFHCDVTKHAVISQCIVMMISTWPLSYYKQNLPYIGQHKFFQCLLSLWFEIARMYQHNLHTTKSSKYAEEMKNLILCIMIFLIFFAYAKHL